MTAAAGRSERSVLVLEQGGRGGVTDYSAALVEALAADGWEVHLATAVDHVLAPIPGVRFHLVFRYVRDRSALGRWLRRSRLSRVVNGLAYVAAVARLVPVARRTGLVHNQGGEFPPLTVVAFAVFRAVGARIVHTPHNTFERGRGLRRSRALVDRLATRIVLHAQADLANLAPADRGRAVVVPHGSYTPLARQAAPVTRAQARAALGLDPDAAVTLLFGQLRADKGLGDVLKAALALPTLRVLVAGEELGALAAETERLAALGDRVTVRAGFQSMDDTGLLFAATDTVVLPYRLASMSGVLLLAYGFARPVIVYPAGGLPEAVVDGETGWICAAADPAALTVVLGEAARGGWAECERRGRAGARLAEERFSWPAIARQTAAVYAQASGRPAPEAARADEVAA